MDCGKIIYHKFDKSKSSNELCELKLREPPCIFIKKNTTTVTPNATKIFSFSTLARELLIIVIQSRKEELCAACV